MAFPGTPVGDLIHRRALSSANRPGDPYHHPLGAMNPQFAGYEPNAAGYAPDRGRGRTPPRAQASANAMGAGSLNSAIRYVRQLVSLRHGDEELVAEHQVYEQTEELEAATLVESLRTEYDQSRAQLQQELSLQAQQHVAHFEHVEATCFTARLRTVETALATEFTAQRAQLLGRFQQECEEIAQQLIQAETRSRDAFRNEANQSEALTTDLRRECQTLQEELTREKEREREHYSVRIFRISNMSGTTMPPKL